MSGFSEKKSPGTACFSARPTAASPSASIGCLSFENGKYQTGRPAGRPVLTYGRGRWLCQPPSGRQRGYWYKTGLPAMPAPLPKGGGAGEACGGGDSSAQPGVSTPPGDSSRGLGGVGGRIPPPPAAVPLPLAREAGDGGSCVLEDGRSAVPEGAGEGGSCVLENSRSAVPEGAGEGRGRGIGQPPLPKGGGAGEACGGGIRPPCPAFLFPFQLKQEEPV